MKFAVYGAGGHSREVADLVSACGYEVACFIDAEVAGDHVPTGLPVHAAAGSCECEAMTIAIGNTAARERVFVEIDGEYALPSLIHPSACVSSHATVSPAVQVMQNVVVNSNAVIWENVILNVGCFVAHDCVVGAHSHIAPGVLMSGGSRTGKRCFLGAGAILLPGVRVGDDTVVGAGAVVTRNVPDGVTVAGVPARGMVAER